MDGQDAVTEITEEDITLTVTEDYLFLDCAKGDYTMYLSVSVADRKAVTQYLYNYNYRTERATEGEWYVYGHRYYYDGDAHSYGAHTPFAFSPEANIIYTESAIKKLQK